MPEGGDTLAPSCREPLPRHREHVVEALGDLSEEHDGTRSSDRSRAAVPRDDASSPFRSRPPWHGTPCDGGQLPRVTAPYLSRVALVPVPAGPVRDIDR